MEITQSDYRRLARALRTGRQKGTGPGARPQTADELWYALLYMLIGWFGQVDPRFDAHDFLKSTYENAEQAV